MEVDFSHDLDGVARPGSNQQVGDPCQVTTRNKSVSEGVVGEMANPALSDDTVENVVKSLLIPFLPAMLDHPPHLRRIGDHSESITAQGIVTSQTCGFKLPVMSDWVLPKWGEAGQALTVSAWKRCFSSFPSLPEIL